MDALFEKIFDKIPRKMVVGLLAMWMIADYAKSIKLEGINEQIWVLAAMTVIGSASIVTHFLLEYKHPTQNGEISKPK